MRLVTAAEIGCTLLHPETQLIMIESQGDMDELFSEFVRDRVVEVAASDMEHLVASFEDNLSKTGTEDK